LAIKSTFEHLEEQLVEKGIENVHELMTVNFEYEMKKAFIKHLEEKKKIPKKEIEEKQIKVKGKNKIAKIVKERKIKW